MPLKKMAGETPGPRWRHMRCYTALRLEQTFTVTLSAAQTERAAVKEFGFYVLIFFYGTDLRSG
jgi:hypothetical protein